MGDFDRRRFLKTLAGGAAGVGLAGCGSIPLDGSGNEDVSMGDGNAGQPNILVICSDEHHPGVAGYRGWPHVKTPNLDRLAKGGAHFTRAYCTSPVCTPSRMSFITGKYVHQIDSWAIGVPLDPEEMTWARRLDQAGIPSTMFGKMDFCGEYQDGGFTDWKILKERKAFDTFPRTEPFVSRLEGYRRQDKRRHLVNAGLEGKPGDETAGEQGRATMGHYEHDRQVVDWSLEYLQEKGATPESGPWCLYVGLIYPHWPYNVAKPYFEQYYPKKIKMPHDAQFPNPDLHPALQHIQRGFDLGEVTDDMMRRTLSAYYGMTTAMDEMIGDILDELKAQGLDENTYIIYTSDHGDSLGEHGMFYKECPLEGSVGVPLIVSGPGVPKGTRVDHPVDLVDMYPTILDMAGLESEPDRPGRSWLPLVRGEEHDRPDYAFAEFHGNFNKHAWYMLARGDYKFIYFVNDPPALFNVKEDPGEVHDLGTDPGHREVVEEFEALLRTILDPEATDRRAKRDLGLIGEDGEDLTLTMTVEDLKKKKEI